MAAIDEILQNLPIDQLAQQVGAPPQEVQAAARAALPALLGGLQANAQGGGADSIVEALGQHDNDLLSGGVDLDQVDAAEGEKIASHIFGPNQEQVYSALGGTDASSGLIKKLIPILAPIVLSYIANKVLKGGGLGGGTAPQQTPAPTDPGAQGGPGSLDSMLRDVLGGALGGGTAPQQPTPAPQQPQQSGGGILDVLGGLLGGGRR